MCGRFVEHFRARYRNDKEVTLFGVERCLYPGRIAAAMAVNQNAVARVQGLMIEEFGDIVLRRDKTGSLKFSYAHTFFSSR